MPRPAATCLLLLLACGRAPDSPVPADISSRAASPVPADSSPPTRSPVPTDSSPDLKDSSQPEAPAVRGALSAVPADSSPAPVAPPPGFVDLRLAMPDACFGPGYAAADNFTGAPLPGYGAPGAWLLAGPAAALARAHAALAADGLALRVFDAYRPRRASAAMVAWAERGGRSDLLRDGYIARRSGHNHGHTVDVGLARRGGCEPLDMGTAWDSFDPASRTVRAVGEARRNRRLLLRVMRAAGFRNYPAEWWHFGLPLAGTRARDVPYGPRDPPESP